MSSLSSAGQSKKIVSYYYDKEIGNFYYGFNHPMRPHRIRVVHDLIINYKLYRKMQVYVPEKASLNEMAKYHDKIYLEFLKNSSPIVKITASQKDQYNISYDCPIMENLYEFCQISAGGSISAAIKLNKQEADIAINWMGGLHHAKKSRPSGFCYVNDVVLAILELLKYHRRVLYIDIDVHYGDGVAEAFYQTDRVMTVSFHKYDGEYFPKTGSVTEIGLNEGKYYSVNFPLHSGINDQLFQTKVFRPIVFKVIQKFQPEVIVLQCGADSLAEDRLGVFNLSLEGHGQCVEFVKKFNLPLLLLGGGGYKVGNVARCWTYETAIALDTAISDNMPPNSFSYYFAPCHKLNIQSSSTIENENSLNYLREIKTKIYENLRHLPPSPSVEFQTIPQETCKRNIEEVDEDPEVRISESASNKKIMNEMEMSDSEDEGDNRRDSR